MQPRSSIVSPSKVRQLTDAILPFKGSDADMRPAAEGRKGPAKERRALLIILHTRPRVSGKAPERTAVYFLRLPRHRAQLPCYALLRPSTRSPRSIPRLSDAETDRALLFSNRHHPHWIIPWARRDLSRAHRGAQSRSRTLKKRSAAASTSTASEESAPRRVDGPPRHAQATPQSITAGTRLVHVPPNSPSVARIAESRVRNFIMGTRIQEFGGRIWKTRVSG